MPCGRFVARYNLCDLITAWFQQPSQCLQKKGDLLTLCQTEQHYKLEQRRWHVDGSAFGAYGLCKYKSTPRSSRPSLWLRQVLQSQQTVHPGVTCRVCIIRAILVISFRRRLSIIVQEFLLSLLEPQNRGAELSRELNVPQVKHMASN